MRAANAPTARPYEVLTPLRDDAVAAPIVWPFATTCLWESVLVGGSVGCTGTVPLLCRTS